MVNPSKSDKEEQTTEPPLSGASVKDSAQQIWQAGLGAFNKAQEEGSKAFEALVKEGVRFQQQTHQAAEEKLAETARKMSSLTTDMSAKATGQWDKLENIFEERVAKALNKLGVPSAKDINALIARIDELNKAVQKLSAKAPTAAAVKSAPQAAPRKTQTSPAVKTKAPAKKTKPAARKQV